MQRVVLGKRLWLTIGVSARLRNDVGVSVDVFFCSENDVSFCDDKFDEDGACNDFAVGIGSQHFQQLSLTTFRDELRSAVRDHERFN